MNPEIRIQDAWLLRDNASKHLHTLWGGDTPQITDTKMSKIVSAYQADWEPYEKRILDAMQEITGLTFKRNVIDCYIAPWFNALSQPLIIGVRATPSEFVDLLTHELLHILLTDSTNEIAVELSEKWETLFGKGFDFATLVHIPVHAIHKQIYLDVLGEGDRYERDVAHSQKAKNSPYKQAWDYVESEGHTEIIAKMKNVYERS